MTTFDGVRIASLLALTLTCAPGCLGTFVPLDPGGSGSGGSGAGVGSGGGGGGTTGGSDGGTAATAADGGSSSDGAPSTGGPACDSVQSTASLSSPSGHHNPGLECMTCHAPGGGAPTFYVGGTLYDSVTGANAVAGATINVTDANGTQVKIVSATNGNFWTTTALVAPLTVNASLCPATTPMNSTVSGNGGCNTCHNSTFRVHVP